MKPTMLRERLNLLATLAGILLMLFAPELNDHTRYPRLPRRAPHRPRLPRPLPRLPRDPLRSRPDNVARHRGHHRVPGIVRRVRFHPQSTLRLWRRIGTGARSPTCPPHPWHEAFGTTPPWSHEASPSPRPSTLPC